eukprot:2173898-Pleurochrysis_carterae.AAC.3
MSTRTHAKPLLSADGRIHRKDAHVMSRVASELAVRGPPDLTPSQQDIVGQERSCPLHHPASVPRGSPCCSASHRTARPHVAFASRRGALDGGHVSGDRSRLQGRSRPGCLHRALLADELREVEQRLSVVSFPSRLRWINKRAATRRHQEFAPPAQRRSQASQVAGLLHARPRRAPQVFQALPVLVRGLLLEPLVLAVAPQRARQLEHLRLRHDLGRSSRPRRPRHDGRQLQCRALVCARSCAAPPRRPPPLRG